MFFGCNPPKCTFLVQIAAGWEQHACKWAVGVLSFLTVSWQPTSRSLVLSDKPINTQMLGAYCYKLNTLPSVVFLNKNLYGFGLWCTWTHHTHPSDQLMVHLKLNNSHWRMPQHWQSRFTEESIRKLPFTDVISFLTPWHPPCKPRHVAQSLRSSDTCVNVGGTVLQIQLNLLNSLPVKHQKKQDVKSHWIMPWNASWLKNVT